MRFNAGIVTDKMSETKEFYTQVLGFEVHFENEFYLLLGSTDGSQLSFLLPEHPSQQPLFRPAFTGKGVYLTIDVEQVDEVYAAIKAKGIVPEIEIRDEPWGDRHFAIVDPNGVGIDIVTFSAPAE